jgi:hypothetical protein
MKPLVLWCRWHEAKLRLHGRSANEVWGELDFSNRTARFRYQIDTRTLTFWKGNTPKTIFLDDMGVERQENGDQQTD